MPYHSFSVTKTARYFTAGPAIAEANGVLIALHGYGQLPEFFMRRLQPLADAGWAIIAPEGLHRFYLEGAHGRVGASWMTKEAREDDIADYVRYLDALSAELGLTERRPVLLGFSQGVATASRWVAMGQTAFSRAGEPVVRTAMRQAMKIMGHQFVMGRTIGEALRRATKSNDLPYRYS
ncbi:MAG: hypothetical protein ACPG08_05475, partial [Flavobacteriales bacterium]